MSRVRFSIAKYVPDLRRMEPRNIGVVVWSETGVAARFAGEFASRPGEVDGRSIPKFVNSASAYRQWIRHWRKVLDKPSVRSSSGELTSRSSPAFLKALAGDERGNYYLVESGELLDPPEPEGIEVFTAWLYEQLVAETLASDEPRDPKLDELCQKAIDETGLGYSRYLRRNYSVEIPLPANSAGSVSERFEFSYAFGNGHPVRLYQQMPLPKRASRKSINQHVHNVAWMFDKVIAAKVISPEEGGVLVLPSESQIADDNVQHGLNVLRSVTRVLNLQEDYDGVRREFESLTSLKISPH